MVDSVIKRTDSGGISVNGTTGEPDTFKTEEEWLESLQGINGQDGGDIYDLAVELGYTGSREDFLASAMGPQGPAGPAGKDGTNGIDGINGRDGRDGIDGRDGQDGKDADLGTISHLDIKNLSMDEITMIFDGGTGSQPQAGNYIPPHLTMKKGTNEVKVVIPNNLSGNYILTLPQESGTLLTAGNLTIDNLNSTLTDKALSANQGRILKNSVDNINTLLTSSDTTLDTLQEVVDFIKINKSTLSSLTIDSIAGLETALTNKLDKNQNAVSASKLATARTIGGVSFDGTSNINLPGVNTAGNQNTTGNSATASKLATPVKINNKLFDGSTNINLEEDAMVVKEKVVNLTGDIIQTSLGSVFIKTITKNTTLSLTTNYNIGETNSFILELTNGGNYTINLWDNIKWNGGVAPELTNNGKDILGFYSYGSPRVTIGAVISKDAK